MDLFGGFWVPHLGRVKKQNHWILHQSDSASGCQKHESSLQCCAACAQAVRTVGVFNQPVFGDWRRTHTGLEQSRNLEHISHTFKRLALVQKPGCLRQDLHHLGCTGDSHPWRPYLRPSVHHKAHCKAVTIRISRTILRDIASGVTCSPPLIAGISSGSP